MFSSFLVSSILSFCQGVWILFSSLVRRARELLDSISGGIWYPCHCSVYYVICHECSAIFFLALFFSFLGGISYPLLFSVFALSSSIWVGHTSITSIFNKWIIPPRKFLWTFLFLGWELVRKQKTPYFRMCVLLDTTFVVLIFYGNTVLNFQQRDGYK